MLCGSPHVAEEIVAEVFAKVLPKWRQGSVTDPVFYLRRAVVNEVRSRHRRRVNERDRRDQRQHHADVEVGDIPVVATGDDVDLMYQLVDLVEPIAATVQRGGYQFNGPLPNGSSELEAPYHRIAMRSPLVSNDDGTFSVAVEQDRSSTS